MRNMSGGMSLLVMGLVVIFPARPMVVKAAVYHVGQGPSASDAHPGTEAKPFKTIARAVKAVQSGDTVIVYAGIYRECVRPTRGGTGPDKMITYQAAPGQRVVIKGTNPFSPAWQPADPKSPSDNFVQAELPDTFFEISPRVIDRSGKPGVYFPFRIPVRAELEDNWPENRYRIRTPEQASFPVVGEVYVAGKPLRQAMAIEECRAWPGTFFVPIDGRKLVVHFLQFTKGPVELTVREQCFAPEFRGLGYLRVSGFVMEQCANQGPFPQMGVLSTRSGHHWLVENNVVRYAATAGIDCGSEHACWYKYRSKAHMEEEGKWAPGSTPAVYETVFLEKGWKGEDLVNHIKQPAPAAGHVIRNNVVADNGMCGIIALKADDLVIEGNLIERNNRRFLYSGVETRALSTCETGGIKLHLTKNSLIRNNLVRDQWGWSPGIWLDNNNDNARVTGNLVLNNFYGIDLEINTEPNLISNNIVAFSRVDGLSSRESTRVKFIHNLVLYSGRWGCAFNYDGTRGGYFHRKFEPPRACMVANNVFAGSVEHCAIRFPLPRKDILDNVVSGNLILDTDARFQLTEPMGSKDRLKHVDLVALAEHWLTERKVPKGDWPDFKTWDVADRWFVGECGFGAFNGILAGGNHIQPIKIPELFGRLDEFVPNPPNAWPAIESRLEGLSPAYELRIDPTGWPAVQPVAGVDRDYRDRPIPAGPVVPGAIQGIKSATALTLWPIPTKSGKENR